MRTSKMYKRSYEKGQRCVILCEGFYEWQTTKELKASERPAYYFYMPQNESVQITDAKTFNGGKDVNLLKMAGLFDIWTDQNGDDMYSYTVITFESDDKFSWLHHRSPAVLETDEQLAVSDLDCSCLKILATTGFFFCFHVLGLVRLQTCING